MSTVAGDELASTSVIGSSINYYTKLQPYCIDTCPYQMILSTKPLKYSDVKQTCYFKDCHKDCLHKTHKWLLRIIGGGKKFATSIIYGTGWNRESDERSGRAGISLIWLGTPPSETKAITVWWKLQEK